MMDEFKSPDILILGGGPAGMAAAHELFRADRSLTVIEKEKVVGGISKTLQFGEYRSDIGPHRFYSQNQYLYDFIKDLLGEEWIKVNRLTRFYINRKFFLYPIKIFDALVGVGPLKALRIIFDYFFERLKKFFVKPTVRSFEDYIVSQFGRSLAELNMLNYTEKIWGLPCSEISPDWAAQRIKGLSLSEVIRKTFVKPKEGPKSLVDRFYYPISGTGLIYETIKNRVATDESCSVVTESFPAQILHDGKSITGTLINIKGELKRYRSKFLLSSIPITEFINLLNPSPPQEVLQAGKKLRFRSHVALFVTLNKPFVFRDQWIYFPDQEIPFGRIMEPRNFHPDMSPEGKTSLLIEFFCWENDRIWNASKEELLEMSIKWLEGFNFIRRDEIIDCYRHRLKYAYPLYDLDYKKSLGVIKEYLNQFINLQLIGRSGRFRYNNQDHALEMGILAARNIIEGKNYNIDEVGKEQAYFERGYLS